MIIHWLGHACFIITAAAGTRVVTDPFDASVGYPFKGVEAEVVTVSHGHSDHNAVSRVGGKPEVVKGAVEKTVRGIVFKGTATYHDGASGRKRGANTVFTFVVDGITVCHLGDLGHTLGPDEVNAIGKVDVLFLPVGGTYTIDAQQAAEVAEALKPRIIVPMHYKTDVIDFPISGVDAFLEGKPRVRREKVLELEAGKLPEETEIVVLDYK